MASTFPGGVVRILSSRDMRMHHYLWHQVRNGWLFFDDATRQAIRELGWEPPRPAQGPGPNGQPRTLLDNDSGEDFLYMHRQMISTVNAELTRIADPSYPKVEGWNKIPPPGDAQYPVPAPYASGDEGLDGYLRDVKSDDTFAGTFVPWERSYTDPAQLRAWTLGELGARLEFTIHNQGHMRWSATPVPGIRPDVDPSTPDMIDGGWDDPLYDWLGDTYSSHANPTFWKLHGWVDDRIEDWRRANNISEIAWKGTWTGKPMAAMEQGSFMMSMSDQMGRDMQQAAGAMDDLEAMVALIARTGRVCHFYDDVSLRGAQTRTAGR